MKWFLNRPLKKFPPTRVARSSSGPPCVELSSWMDRAEFGDSCYKSRGIHLVPLSVLN